MMKVGDLVSISAKGRRGFDGWSEEYTYGIVIAAIQDPRVSVVVQWINGERVSMMREDLKYAKLPVQRPRGGQ